MFKHEHLELNAEKGIKSFLSQKLVLHCHHYNARLQRTIENNFRIDGKGIFKNASFKIFYEMLAEAKLRFPHHQMSSLSSNLYSFLGLGRINLAQVEHGIIFSDSSHFVEGWRIGSVKRKGPICSFTSGYLEAVALHLTNENYDVTEVSCMNDGHEQCQFKLSPSKSPKAFKIERTKIRMPWPESSPSPEDSGHVDKKAIIEAVINMPLFGNNEGLIPAFHVYISQLPQDFYGIVCSEYLKAMGKIGLEDLASKLLIEDAEYCALSTFNGVMGSEEWNGLVGPMIQEDRDKVFGLIAVANALGWGRVGILSHTGPHALELCSSNSYEAESWLELVGLSSGPTCNMLTGISSGLMSLIYGRGDIEHRPGTYQSRETSCLAKGDSACTFKAEYAY